jgi:cyclophilin family peptidyl-prolyl cis-trans isomerase
MPIHDKAILAGQAAEAAGSQGRFWEMHDLLYERQEEWEQLSIEDFSTWLISILPELELDQDAFIEFIESEESYVAMQEHFISGIAFGLSGTPSILINDFYYQLEPSLQMLEASIRLELLEPLRQNDYPPFTISADTTYFAHLELNVGKVVIQLYPNEAPLAVNNFISLARDGWYDNNSFFRVIPGRLVESGDPTGTGFGDQGYYFEIETDTTLVFDKAGLVALSSSGPNTNSSKFFISLSPLPELNETRTIFGRVTEGLDLLIDLQARDPLEELLTTPQVVINTITIEEK